jgi:type I restriction enzyme, S subunit
MSGKNEIKYSIPGWAKIPLAHAVSKISTSGKNIKQADYLSEGAFPIIDQGQDYIGGYTNDATKLIECDPPLIVFGDHTRLAKFVDQRFAPGADGVVILSPHKCFNAKLLASRSIHGV